MALAVVVASVDHLKTRKGAFRIAFIPPEVLRALNDGLLETVNLNEFMALELPQLARSVAGHVGLDAQANAWSTPSPCSAPSSRCSATATSPARSTT
jgi:hypothetical protein